MHNIPRLAVIGTSRRFYQYYEDILHFYSDAGIIEIVGVWNRTIKKANKASQTLGCQVYDSFQALNDDNSVDGVLNLIRGPEKFRVAEVLMSAGKHVYLETPAGVSSSHVRRLASKANENVVQVQVAEDSAFIPEARLQQEVVAAGVLGNMHVVINDEAAFANHAFARLQVLLGDWPQARSFWWNRVSGNPRYDLFGISFDDFQYVQRFPVPKGHISRRWSTWKIVFENGIIEQHFSPEDGLDAPVRECLIRAGDREFHWEAPSGTEQWHRKKHALAYLVEDFAESIRTDRTVTYGIERAVSAIKYWRISKMVAKLPFPARLPATPLIFAESML